MVVDAKKERANKQNQMKLKELLYNERWLLPALYHVLKFLKAILHISVVKNKVTKK